MARSELRVDCSAERKIERDTTMQNYFPFELDATGADQPNSVNNTRFFCFADETAGGYPANAAPFPGGSCQIPNVEFIDDGEAFCDAADQDPSGTLYPRHRSAMVIRAGDHQFYGGEIATWDWNTGIFPRFIPDGIAFWARSDVQSDKVITVYLTDYQSGAPADTVPGTRYSATLAAKGLEAGCTPTAGSTAMQMGVSVTVVSSDPNVQTSTSNLQMVTPAGQCGNRWRRLLQTTENWELHLLPFDTFYQDLQPSRAPDGLQTSYDLDPTDATPPQPSPFYTLNFGIGRGSTVSLWIDEVFFYRKKTSSPTD